LSLTKILYYVNQIHIITRRMGNITEKGVLLVQHTLFLVDDIGLEPMTFRTSSGCWIRCPIQKVQKSIGNTYLLPLYYTIKLGVNQAKSAKIAIKLTFC